MNRTVFSRFSILVCLFAFVTFFGVSQQAMAADTAAKTAISSSKAPAAIGPYSQAIGTGTLIFVSGQLPLDAKTKKMPEAIADQAKMSLENIKAILEETGSSMDKVVKTTIFLADIKDFAAVNEVYATYFTAPFPARSTIAVKDLPMGAGIEIEAVALP